MRIEAATQPASPETPTPSSPPPSPCPPTYTHAQRCPEHLGGGFLVHSLCTGTVRPRGGPRPHRGAGAGLGQNPHVLSPGPYPGPMVSSHLAQDARAHPHKLTTALQPLLLCSCILIKFTGSSTTMTAASSLQACEVGRARASIPLCRCGIRSLGKRTGPKVRAEPKCSAGWCRALYTAVSTTFDPASANSQAQSSPSLPGRGAHHDQSVPRTGPGLMRTQEGPRSLHLQPQHSGDGFRQRSDHNASAQVQAWSLPCRNHGV